MIVVLKPNPNPEQVQGFISWLEGKGIAVHKSVGVNETVFGLVGDTASLDIGLIAALAFIPNIPRFVRWAERWLDERKRPGRGCLHRYLFP